jgi:DNA-binding transcriptional LysR family regulator
LLEGVAIVGVAPTARMMGISAGVMSGLSTKAHERPTEDRNIFVASPDYLARAPLVAIPADLAKQPLIGFAAFGRRQSFQLEASDGTCIEVAMECRVTTTSGLAIRHWALAGVGVARMARQVVRAEINRGTLIHVLSEYTALGFPLFAVYMPEHFRPANVRRLIDHAMAYFSNDLNFQI